MSEALFQTMAPARKIHNAVPANADLPDGIRGTIYVESAGNLQYHAADGGVSRVLVVTTGQMIPVIVKRITTNTTADVTILYN